MFLNLRRLMTLTVVAGLSTAFLGGLPSDAHAAGCAFTYTYFRMPTGPAVGLKQFIGTDQQVTAFILKFSADLQRQPNVDEYTYVADYDHLVPKRLEGSWQRHPHR